MCGIFGVYSKEHVVSKKLEAMGEVITHRGPDDNGTLIYKNMAIGNQRLSIIDLSSGGHQPMISQDEQIAVVQNGEIFNYLELKEELQALGYNFKSESDTEVILALYEKLGKDFVSKLNGMFSIAIIDKRIDTLFLYRDRLGEKPLYIATTDTTFIFASEIKSILEYSAFTEIESKALHIYMQLGFVPPPYTMFKGILQVTPGSCIEIKDGKMKESIWWSLEQTQQDNSMTEETAIKDIQDIFSDAVAIRMRADVPFGAFLSGGIDSSYCVSAMTKHTSQKIKTFNMAFPNTIFDEGEFAVKTSERFKTEHHTIQGSMNLLENWPKAVYHCDQPHADVSFIPTMMLSELTAKHIKVVLTGDGADEFFSGYTKYLSLCDQENATADDVVNQYIKDHSIFTQKELNEMGIGFTQENHFLSLLKSQITRFKSYDVHNLYLALDCYNLLPGNNLVKPDRMGMAHSIEARQPFMDYRMIEHAFRIPGAMKVKERTTKYILKKATVDDIGYETAYRSKRMFTVPITEWSQQGLYNIASTMLLSEDSFVQTIVQKSSLKEMIDAHKTNNQLHLKQLRLLISLEIWHRLFIRKQKLSEVNGVFKQCFI